MSTGKIVILNGTSSSGKSSILHALQELCAEPYLDAGLDRFLHMLPRRYLRAPLWDEVLGRATTAGAVGHQLVTSMHHAVAALAKTGINVVADHVLVERAWVDECAQLFGDLPAYLIGVHCRLELLEQREKARLNRTWGQARAQLSIVHAHTVYDLEVDTGVLSAEASAQQIVARLADGVPAHAWRQLRERMAR